MINLIPKEEKKRMIADFRYRLAISSLLILCFCVLVAAVAMLPSYFISIIKNSSVARQLQIQKNEPLPVLAQESLTAVKDINNKLSLVENSEKNKFPLSVKVINAILSNKRPDIKITQILYNNGALGKKISITGTAPSREVLLLFRQSLEDNPNFKSVDLPISNFIKGSDIQFYLSLVPAQYEK